MTGTHTYWLEHAWLGTHVEPGVALDISDGRIAAVHTGTASPPPGAEVLRGLTLPGLANAHSHAFHRALRGTVQVGSGTFWTWRGVMYATADRLTPETYHALARAVYAEMALAGITAVGEFHYVHHAPGGAPYAEPNAMGEALVAAAAEAGIRITLLDTAYLSSGFGQPPTARQLRFCDGDVDAWADRCPLLKERDHARIGAAIHSVRAVPAGQLETVARWAGERLAPLHVHLSEQTAENDACLSAHGRTPTRLLADHGVLGPRFTIGYVVPGPNSVASRVVQFFYPYAKPVPLTYMKPGQSYWGARKTLGGCFRSSTALTRALVQAGLPAGR